MKRSFVKTLTYRTMNGLYGFSVAMVVTGNYKVAATIVGVEAIYKMVAYFAHERVWEGPLKKVLY
jgi:uncharacterized membrane protein